MEYIDVDVHNAPHAEEFGQVSHVLAQSLPSTTICCFSKTQFTNNLNISNWYNPLFMTANPTDLLSTDCHQSLSQSVRSCLHIIITIEIICDQILLLGYQNS